MGAEDHTISLDSQVELDSEAGQFDLATYVAAVALGNAALPQGMPEWMRAAIEAKAEAIRADPDNPLIAHMPGERTTADRQEREANNRQAFNQVFQRLQRERDEWAHTSSTVGGVTMTGAEWSKLAERLRTDEDLHQRLIEVFRKRGMSENEAQARYDRVTQAAEIAAIPPSQRSEEQKAVEQSNASDPTFKQDVAAAARFASIKDSAPQSKLNQSFEHAANDAPVAAAPPTVSAPPALTINATGPGF